MKTWPLALVIGSMVVVAGCATVYDVPGVREIGKIASHKGTPEEQVTALLNDLARSIETRKVNRILAQFSPSYTDGWGRNRASLEAYVRDVYQKYRTISVTRVAPSVQIEGDKARVVETFGAVAEPRDAAKEPPINLEGQLSVRLERVDGDWLIVECRFL